jgi:hypothetical protein
MGDNPSAESLLKLIEIVRSGYAELQSELNATSDKLEAAMGLLREAEAMLASLVTPGRFSRITAFLAAT